jgi:hypothetical protein
MREDFNGILDAIGLHLARKITQERKKEKKKTLLTPKQKENEKANPET